MTEVTTVVPKLKAVGLPLVTLNPDGKVAEELLPRPSKFSVTAVVLVMLNCAYANWLQNNDSNSRRKTPREDLYT